MVPVWVWIAIGAGVGVAAGAIGAYAGWRRGRGGISRSLALRILAAVIVLAATGLLVIIKLPISWENRACLFLAPGLLLYGGIDLVRRVDGGR